MKYFHKITFQKEIKDFEKPSSSDQKIEKLKKLPFSERFYVSNKLMEKNTVAKPEEKKLKTTKAAKVKSRLRKETVKKVFKEFFYALLFLKTKKSL